MANQVADEILESPQIADEILESQCSDSRVHELVNDPTTEGVDEG
jgi:hypothetical protein